MTLECASPVGTGRVRPTQEKAAAGTASMGWLQASFILFAFAAPSAVMAVPYAIGMAGMIGGVLICLVITTASSAGAWMVLQAKLQYPFCHTFGDLGQQVMGRPGKIWGNVIQLGNFCLFMPCALQFCALALEGIGNGIPGFNGCSDYYVFVIAALCFLTTQVRTLSNTQILSLVSIISVFGMFAIMMVAAFQYEKSDKIEAQWFGNPVDGINGIVMFAGGFTINAWAFVPGFLTVELSTCMESPADFKKSLIFAGLLNIFTFVVLGTTVVSRWGYDVGEVIGITSGVAAWSSGMGINTAFNTFQLIGNFVSYMLDSVPLGRYCQKVWNPQFKDTWSAADILRYLGYTLPAFLLAFFLSIAVPSVNTLLDFTTAFTTPWVTQIYPAVLYWKLRRNSASPRTLLNGATSTDGMSQEKGMSTIEKAAIAFVFVVGCISCVLCTIKAVGYILIDDLRPPLQIGCAGWLIWKD